MKNRARLFPFWIPLLFGLMASVSALGNPRLAALHGSDIVQLIAIGLCFGVALATFVAFLRGPRSNPHDGRGESAGDRRDR